MGVTYVTGYHTLRPPDTECKHLAFNSAMIDLKDRVCLQNSPGGGRSGISGQQSIASMEKMTWDLTYFDEFSKCSVCLLLISFGE